MALLIGLLLFRRRSRRRTNRLHLTFQPHQATDGSFMCVALGPSRSSTDQPVPCLVLLALFFGRGVG